MTRRTPVDVPPRVVASMALHMEPEDVADRLKVPIAFVLEVLGRRRDGRRWIARCDRTGEKITAFTERGAYLRAQIAGFADWTLYGERTEHDGE